MTMRRRSGGTRGSVRRSFDEFGFAFTKRRERKLLHRCHEYSYPQPNAVKVKELCELLSYWHGSSFICRSQIERFMRLGIPPAFRGRVWKCLLDIDKVRVSSDFNYQTCLREIRQPLVDLSVSEFSIISAISTLEEREDGSGSLGGDVALFRQIALDLQRSFPTHRSLMGDSPEAIEGQTKLFRVLTAYAKYNPHIGYSQGMSYIAAVLLMLLGEEEAFWALVVLLEKPKYLSELFDSSLKKIQHQALVFQHLLKHRKPQLFQHLEKLGVSSIHFIMQWFMTLFTSLPCWDSVMAIWDLFLLHGLSAVFRAALTILQMLESRLMSMTDEAAVLPILLRVPADISEYSVLIPAVWSMEVQEWEIKCMNSLILEETAEEHHTEKGPESGVSLSSEEQKDSTSRPPAKKPEEDEASTKEAAGFAGKNVFARILKVAQRYLADSTRQSKATPNKNSPAAVHILKKRTSASSILAQKRRSQRRQSHNAPVGGSRRRPVTPQDPYRGATEDSPQTPFRRLHSGPVGRVARRHSGSQSSSVKSLLPRTQPCFSSSLRHDKGSEESLDSPHRVSSPGCPPLSESNTDVSSVPVTQERESQLI